MLGHGLQMLHEFLPARVTEGIRVELNSTEYFPLAEVSNYDSIYGIWFYVESFTGGVGNLTVTLQGASDNNQSTWVDIGAGVAMTLGTPAVPIQYSFMRAPLVAAVGAAFITLPPFIRFKLVTDVGATAVVSKITRTIRGLA